MKNRQDEIDELIRHALTEDEAKFYDDLGEQNLTEMVGGLFQGKMKGWTILTMIVQVIMFGLCLYFAIQFFQEEDLRTMIQYGAGALTFLLATSYIKLFHWMMMDKNAILRELKRLELQVAALASKIND